MDLIAFNEHISNNIVSAQLAEDVLKNYRDLKKVNKKRGIITENNKKKFITLLKELNRCIADTDFSYESFYNMDLNQMQFSHCTFIKTNFENAKLDVIEFHSCNLDFASFRNAVMDCAGFQKCSCRKTNFSKAHLMAAYIQESDWSEANISGVNLNEVEAHKWEISGMIVDENTAIVDGEFYHVNWSKVNVSRLNISLNQVKYFLQSTNGGKDLQVYEDYSPSLMQKREDAILKALWDEHKQNEMRGGKGDQGDKDLIFLSYASEQEKIVRGFYEVGKTKQHLWMDVELVREDELKMQVDKIINCCATAVIFLSKEYLIKAWTRYELWRLLQEKKKRRLEIIIVPLTEGVEEIMERYCDVESFVVVKDIGELGYQINL